MVSIISNHDISADVRNSIDNPIISLKNSTETFGTNSSDKSSRIVNSPRNYFLFWTFGLGGSRATPLSARNGTYNSLTLALKYPDKILGRLYKLRIVGLSEPGGFLGSTEPRERISEFALLSGSMAKAHTGYIAASSGLGFLSGIKRGRFLYYTGGMFGNSYYERQRIITVGIPFEAEVFWTPFRTFGLGVVGYYNLNSKCTFGGVAFSLQIGKLRTK